MPGVFDPIMVGKMEGNARIHPVGPETWAQTLDCLLLLEEHPSFAACTSLFRRRDGEPHGLVHSFSQADGKYVEFDCFRVEDDAGSPSK